jgi:hypothetical protein
LAIDNLHVVVDVRDDVAFEAGRAEAEFL